MQNKIVFKGRKNKNIFKITVLLVLALCFSIAAAINGVMHLPIVSSATEIAELANASSTNIVIDDGYEFNAVSAYAPTSHRVLPGDTMWKIAVRYEIGLAELIRANPQIKNAALIYVGQIINIPEGAPLKALEDEVLRLVNVYRSQNGLQMLRGNWEASRVARIKSQDMINNRYFSHNSPVYGSPFKMMEAYGLRFSAAGENIAKGQRTAQEVMTAWMNSPGHRANILNPTFTQLGVGAAKDYNGTLHWTQMFLKPY